MSYVKKVLIKKKSDIVNSSMTNKLVNHVKIGYDVAPQFFSKKYKIFVKMTLLFDIILVKSYKNQLLINIICRFCTLEVIKSSENDIFY